ncbi:hypothetical protein BU14_0219s0006 [Porphyra umbilicalis]|uniref:Uncharacterized protein n=1 Tax=Porphyra umbilicalis TaxID=2786 RepID=A0A1X6P4W6_PORUM|nr:hypothetical protein BU14_0219s0006 [Porphyra umbilicalis]|eukprot:OSX75806.1 hypothetical protein BU14_0219s0006 [Porphyra umbilicalis]
MVAGETLHARLRPPARPRRSWPRGGAVRAPPPRGCPPPPPPTRRATSTATAAAAAVAALVVAVAAVAAPTPVAARCASRLFTHPDEYARCKTGTTCFLFLTEVPIIRLNATVDAANRGTPLDPRVLFPCVDYAVRGLSGLGWKLHSQLFPGNDDWCALAGAEDECTFNELIATFRASTVDAGHPGYGMGLAASGAWVLTEWRADKATASDPYMEDEVVLVRRKTADGFGHMQRVDFPALLRPFTDQSWVLLGGSAVAFVAVVAALALWQPTSVGQRRSWRLRMLQWVSNFVRILLGGELRREERHFGPARSLLLGTLVVCATTFALFYEAAFILNSISTGLISPVSGLSDAEMCRWTVLRGAATEDIFVELVNEGRGSGARATVAARSWSTCDTVHECIERVVNGSTVTAPRCEGAAYTTTEVYLSWKTTILAEFRANTSLCEELDVVDADESFFRFNVAWHFADVNASAPGAGPYLPAWSARRQAINAGFRRARLRQDTQKIVEQEAGKELPCSNARQQVHLGLLLVPTLLVLLVGLTGAIAATVAVPVLHRALAAGVARERAADEAAGAAKRLEEGGEAEATLVNLPPFVLGGGEGGAPGGGGGADARRRHH